MLKKTSARIAQLIGVTLITGCASIRDGSEQYLIISDRYRGASIYHAGKNLGQAPKVIKLSRWSRSPIELKLNDKHRLIPIDSSYRWTGSFARNLIFFSLAPFGMAYDLVSGAAFNLRLRESVGDASLKGLKTSDAQDISAIAPPLADSMALSDSAGEALETELKKSSTKEKLLSFRATKSTFVEEGYDFDEDLPDSSRAALYGRLGINHVYESVVDESGDKVVLSSRKRGVFDQSEHKASTLILDAEKSPSEIPSAWLSLIPNAIGVDFSNSKIRIDDPLGKEHYFRDVPNNEWWETGIQYLSSVYIGNIPELRKGRKARFNFQFSPLISASYKEVLGPDLPTLTAEERDTTYTRARIGGGLGPELGYQVGRNYVYLNLIPVFYWSQLTWKSDSDSGSVSAFNFTIASEIGYLWAYDQEWTVKLFVRSLPEHAALWKEAFKGTNLEFYPDTTSSVVSGLAIAYRFGSLYSSNNWKPVESGKVRPLK